MLGVRAAARGGQRPVGGAGAVWFAALAAPVGDTPEKAVSIARVGKLLRARQGGDELPDVGLLPACRAAGHDAIRFEPCPNSDFNGADFPYFASFQAFVDRAEWASRPTPHDGGAVCADRDENG